MIHREALFGAGLYAAAALYALEPVYMPALLRLTDSQRTRGAFARTKAAKNALIDFDIHSSTRPVKKGALFFRIFSRCRAGNQILKRCFGKMHDRHDIPTFLCS